MKTRLFTIAFIVSMMFLASCKEKEAEPIAIDIPINKESIVTADNIVPPSEGTEINQNKDGLMSITKAVPEPAVLEAVLEPGTLYHFPKGNYKLDKKYIPANSDGINPGILLEIDNPGGDAMLLGGVITVGELSSTIPDIVITKEKETVFISNGQDLPAPDYDDMVILPKELQGKLQEGFEVSDLTIMKFRPTESKMKLMGTEVNVIKKYTVAVKFVCPMSYKKGTVLHIERYLTDLGININDYLVNLTTKDFKVSVDITSTVPFDIAGRMESEEGMSGELDNVIKAGTINDPVTTEAILSVKRDSKNKKTLENAMLYVDLTAGKDAVIKAGQTLKMDVEKITLLI